MRREILERPLHQPPIHQQAQAGDEEVGPPPSHGYHAPNENYDWEQAGGGIAAFAHYFQTVSGIK